MPETESGGVRWGQTRFQTDTKSSKQTLTNLQETANTPEICLMAAWSWQSKKSSREQGEGVPCPVRHVQRRPSPAQQESLRNKRRKENLPDRVVLCTLSGPRIHYPPASALLWHMIDKQAPWSTEPPPPGLRPKLAPSVNSSFIYHVGILKI